MKSKKICPLATRIKKMMQTDDDVGKISQATPILIGRAMELFLEKLCKQAIGIAQSRQAKTLTPSHLKAAVSSDTTLDFLAELVAPAPDLPAPDADGGDGAPKPAKRRRTNDTGDGPTSPQGRGRPKQQQADRAEPAAGDPPGDTPAPKPRGRAPKPPMAPTAAGGSEPPSRASSGSLADQSQLVSGAAPSGRRGGGRPRKDSKAAAAAVTDVAPGEHSAAAGDAAFAAPLVLGGLHCSAPQLAAIPSPVEVGANAQASGAALQAASAGCTPAAAAPKPSRAGGAPGTGAGGSGGSVVASLRAQQPFFGLGRRGKNLGPKSGGSTPAAPSPATLSAMQQQLAQQLSEAGALGLLPLTGSTQGDQTSAALKLEPLDLSRPPVAFAGLAQLPIEALHCAGFRTEDAGVNGSGSTDAATTRSQPHSAVKLEPGDTAAMSTASLSPFQMRQHNNPSGAMLTAAPGSMDAGVCSFGSDSARPHSGSAGMPAGPSGSLEQPQLQLSIASSSHLPPVPAAAGGVSGPGTNGSAAAGTLLPQLGPSLALYQPQGDMDDDYDDC